MDVKELIILVFFVVTTGMAWIDVPSYWDGRNQRMGLRVNRIWVLLTRPAQRGLYRASLVLPIGATMFTAGIIAFLVAEALVDSDPPQGVLIFSAISMMGGLLLFVLLSSTIMVFNRPRLLVAPRLRKQPGLATLWRRAFRIRRAERRQKRQARRLRIT